MPKTLAELRTSRAVSLPERTYEICLAQKLVAEAGVLADEQFELELERRGDPDGPTKPRRQNQPSDVRYREIEDRLAELHEEMREHTGELLLRAQESGWWTVWRDANPARVIAKDNDGRPLINPVDEQVTGGYCDSTALQADLERYVVSYNGEPVGPEQWEFIASKAAPGDLKELCTVVVNMHEGRGAKPPKASSKPSSSSPRSEPDSRSPEASASPSDDS